MNSRQNNKFRMYKAVSAVLAEHAESVRSLAAFVPAVEQFNDIIMQIFSQDQRILESSVGKTAAKDSIEASLKIIVLKVSSALASLAYRSGDQELAAAVRCNKSDLDHQRQTNLDTTAKIIDGIATAYQVQLAAYGIDAAQLTALNRMSVAYSKAVGRKEGGYAARSSAVTVIKELFRINDRNLREDIDRIMQLFRYEQADFYYAYRAARYIKNLGHRFRVKVVEPSDEEKS